MFRLICFAVILATGGCSDEGEPVVDAGRDSAVPMMDAGRDSVVMEDIGPPDVGTDSSMDAGPVAEFTAGHVFIAGSRNAEVFEFTEDLELVTRWTHPMFGEVLAAPGQTFAVGPQGMAFDSNGFLVVATLTHFCVFSAPGEVVACHEKVREQATENIIFDSIGNLYTTTATGGTNEVHKYTADYEFLTTFAAPQGELTGITCDPDSNLYVASQTGAAIYKFDKDDLSVLETIPVLGNVEGLQFFGEDAIYVAAHGAVPAIQLVTADMSGDVTFGVVVPDMAFAVPITTDAEGRIYTADYENGGGTAPADLVVVNPDGSIAVRLRASPVYGPFGMVIAGVELPCGAFQLL